MSRVLIVEDEEAIADLEKRLSGIERIYRRDRE